MLAYLKKCDTKVVQKHDIKSKIEILSTKIANGAWGCLAKLVLSFCYMAIDENTKANNMLVEVAKDEKTPREIAEFARSLIV